MLSFYYPPDLSAGSFRATALVAALRARAASDVQIDVVTTAPNRYSSFSQAAAERETRDGVDVLRIALPAHRSDMPGQSAAFLHFARRSLAHVADRRYDLVLATSSRLLTAALGAWIARRKRAKLYLDIRDIFAETISDVLGGPLAWPIKRVAAALEGWTLRRADRINLVSPGFEEYFRERYGQRPFAWFTNGIDDEFIEAAAGMAPLSGRAAPVTIVYAGNIGESQALHAIVPQLAQALGEQVRLIVIGDGGRRELLAATLRQAGIANVELRPPVARAQLLQAYQAADVLFLHLGRQPAFERVLPSKLFEYAALGKPILAGVGGYAARFVREEISNAAVFPPGDTAQAVRAYGSLDLHARARPEFIAKFARANIVRAMADDVLELANAG